MSLNSTRSLASLPRELLDDILSQVEGRADLSSLLRTSKSLRSLTIELVFENVAMLWTGPDEADYWKHRQKEHLRLQKQNARVIKTGYGSKRPRLDLLFRSILERPKHGEHVRQPDLQCIRYRDYLGYGKEPRKPELPAPPNSDHYHRMVQITMRSLGLDQSRLEEDIENGLNGTILALLLAYLSYCVRI